MKIETNAIVEAYKNGKSMNAIAKAFGTYPTTIKRVLKRNNVELRHDVKRKGSLYVQNGEKLIEWAKAQGRLVTKVELAKIIGTKRLSPSYFVKYPELGKYVKLDIQNDLQEYYDKLYEWLQKNNIDYKPQDRTKINMTLDALLLGKYSNIALCIYKKPKTVSTNKYEINKKEKIKKARKAGITLIFIKNFEDFDTLKDLLDSLIN